MRKKKRVRAIFKVYEDVQLQRFLEVEDGDMIECLRCGKNHELLSAICTKSKIEDDLFLVYKCRRQILIGAIFGRLIADRIPSYQK